MLQNARVPLIGFAAYSGTGKTTLLRKVLPLLKKRGLRIGLVKHAHHAFDVDHPGKDSYELRKAGAERVLVASRHRWALMVETGDQGEPRLDAVLAELNQEHFDLILVEGFKHEAYPKIELHRPSTRRPLLYPQDPTVVAVATDAELDEPLSLPVLDLNDADQVARFVCDWMEGQRDRTPIRERAR